MQKGRQIGHSRLEFLYLDFGRQGETQRRVFASILRFSIKYGESFGMQRMTNIKSKKEEFFLASKAKRLCFIFFLFFTSNIDILLELILISIINVRVSYFDLFGIMCYFPSNHVSIFFHANVVHV